MRKRRNRGLSLVAMFIFLSILTVNAEEMPHKGTDHHALEKNAMDQHKMDMPDMKHQTRQQMKPTQAQLHILDQIPASGKSREAGFDGRYVMEPTSVSDDIKTQCAYASRGLVMVDNATLTKCDKKFQGNGSNSNSNTVESTGKIDNTHMMH